MKFAEKFTKILLFLNTKNIHLLLIFNYLFIIQSFAQLDNSLFYETSKYKYTDTSKLSLDLQSLSFAHNREYFLPVAKGYTLFGNQLCAKLIYKPAVNVKLELGGFFSKDFGNKKFTLAQPWFLVQFKKDCSVVNFGNLNGNLAHKLVEPLYQFEGLMLNPLEQGIQWLRQTKKSELDLWVDWQNMIYQTSTDQEIIWGGINYMLKGENIALPIQATAYHKGGQIGQNYEPVITQFNFAIGPRITTKNKKTIVNMQYVKFAEQSSREFINTKNGDGIFLNTQFQLKKSNLVLSFWNGKDYYAPYGGDLYLSQDKYDPMAYVQNTQWLMLRWLRTFNISENLKIIARFEPFYELKQKQFQHAEGLFFVYKQQLGLSKKSK